jgi:hypothetical protein
VLRSRAAAAKARNDCGDITSHASFSFVVILLRRNSRISTMHAHISYTADTGEKLVNETFGPNNIRAAPAARPAASKLSIATAEPRSSLERNGFELVEHRTAVKTFFDRRRAEDASTTAK